VNLLRLAPAAIFLSLIALLPEPARAVLVVDWGGQYVFSDQAMQTGGFSGTNPLQLNPSAGYSGTSAIFSGAVAITGSRTRATVVQNSGVADRIQLKFSDGGTGVGSALVLWNQANFLGGMSSGNVGFLSTDTISMDIATYAQFTPGRLVIQQGGSYYVSEEVFDATGSFVLNPTALDWFNYNPTGWDPANAATLSTIGSAATPVSGGMLSDVTKIGFLFTSNDAGSNAIRISSFEVNMSAIPEPGSAALLVGGLAVLFVRRGRSRAVAGSR
jgi:hypothetical protein